MVVLVAAAVVAGAGCTGVPTSGPVTVVRHVPAEAPEPPEPRLIQHVATDPEPNATPDAIVRGYLTAQADARNDHGIARKYLAPRVPWKPEARVTVYASPRIGKPVVHGDTATVVAAVTRVGTINPPHGEFAPPPAPAGTSVTFHLRKVTGSGWRLADAPAGVLLTRDEVGFDYLRTTLYWPDQARRLVPVPVFLAATDQPVPTVVRALLAGPPGTVARAVRNAIPEGTRLLDATVVDGVATLNFSREVTGAPQESVGALVAQLVWTLTEPALGVTAVRVDAEGDPLVVPGRPNLRDHRRTDWTEYASVPPTSDGRLFFARDGGAFAVDEAGRASRVSGLGGVLSVAVNRAGTLLAAVTAAAGGRQSLVVADLTGSKAPRTLLTGDRITAPAWEPAGDTVWAVQVSGGTEQVVAVPAAGSSGVVTVAASLPPGPVASLRLSPDGARALLVIGTELAAQRLWVARVERPAAGGRVLADPRQVVPGVAGVTAAAFDGATQILLAAWTGTRVGLFKLDIDGYNLVTQRADGLPAAPVAALTVSAGAATGTLVDRVASSAGRLWRRTPATTWGAISGSGAAATYAG